MNGIGVFVGYSDASAEEDIRGILGLNWLGAARQVWK